jgi:esterase
MPGELVDLAFEVAGSGPAVLLLHGLFASSANWHAISAELARSHRVYSVDLRNHGRSPRSANMSYLSMADDVLRLIEREGLERSALVGHSMGGKVAMALALTTPRAVGSLSVIDVAPVCYVDRWSQQLRSMMATQAVAPPAGHAGPESALLQWAMPRLDAAHAFVDWRSNLPAIALSLHELCGFPRHLRHLDSRLPLQAIVGGRSDWVRPADV